MRGEGPPRDDGPVTDTPRIRCRYCEAKAWRPMVNKSYECEQCGAVYDPETKTFEPTWYGDDATAMEHER